MVCFGQLLCLLGLQQSTGGLGSLVMRLLKLLGQRVALLLQAGDELNLRRIALLTMEAKQ